MIFGNWIFWLFVGWILFLMVATAIFLALEFKKMAHRHIGTWLSHNIKELNPVTTVYYGRNGTLKIYHHDTEDEAMRHRK